MARDLDVIRALWTIADSAGVVCDSFRVQAALRDAGLEDADLKSRLLGVEGNRHGRLSAGHFRAFALPIAARRRPATAALSPANRNRSACLALTAARAGGRKSAGYRSGQRPSHLTGFPCLVY